MWKYEGVEHLGERTYPKINGENHYFLPTIFINGSKFDANKGGIGEGGWYGDSNNIVLNMPNIDSISTGKKVAR